MKKLKHFEVVSKITVKESVHAVFGHFIQIARPLSRPHSENPGSISADGISVFPGNLLRISS